MGAAIMCIVVAAGAGHFTQSVREEAARVAAAEKAAAAHQTEEARIAAAQVAGLKKRLTAMQTQISTQRDNLLTDLQGIIVAGEKHSDVAEMLRRYERFAIGPKAEPREVEAPVAPAPEPPRSTPSVPIAPEPVMPLDTPAAQKRVPAAKPRTAVTGEPGKVQVLDW